MRKCLATLFYAPTSVHGQPSTLSHPRSALYFCHENGPRPPSPPPATSITILSARSRYKIYRPDDRNPKCVLADCSIADSIDSLISMRRYVRSRQRSVKVLFLSRADNVTRAHSSLSLSLGRAIFMDNYHVRLSAKLL